MAVRKREKAKMQNNSHEYKGPTTIHAATTQQSTDIRSGNNRE
jgi:hypothetical protein